ncbi:hypothetical protein [Magnetovibrio blakemorei]|jgi:hypothetical protein|uniref:hypothetical protein n=1 Tax=Magnetovibrio blakemorei TaxID=28181 RepID=UPI000859A688|nr:hypothetical protein [Magnetovibrio blakemorei]
MKNCLLCPKGTKCRGYVLSELILKLYDAVEQHGSGAGYVEALTKSLTRQDMELLSEQGQKARVTCWSKGFVLVLARKVADLSRTVENDDELRIGIERLVVSVDGLFTKLPKGLSIDLSDLIMDVFNRATEILSQEGGKAGVPATILGKVIFDAARTR